MMIAREHQEIISGELLDILAKYGLGYLAMEERTGKTITALLAVEKSTLKNCLIITKKKPLEGWRHTLSNIKLTKKYTLTNYHQVNKLGKRKFDVVILDESHAYLSKYPKTGAIWKDVAQYTSGAIVIYLSATPSAQTYSLLFNQFRLSDWSPWAKYTNFYQWHKWYGVEKQIKLGGKLIRMYDETKKDKVWDSCKHLFISYTRQELGFEHEPEDSIHFVPLLEETKDLYNTLLNDRIIMVDGVEIIADSVMALWSRLHQIEGGTIKWEEKMYMLDNTEKIDYIKEHWGDSEDLVIFYYYNAELILLQKHFKKAKLLQATSYAEGIDLSMYEHTVVYSMSYSTSQYVQRRARQANMDRETPINVHFLLVAGALSEQIYVTVAQNKSNFNDKYFTGEEL